MASTSRPETDAQRVRSHIRTHYVEPARRRGLSTVVVIAGNLYREIGFSKNNYPNICQVMESNKLLKEVGASILHKKAPPKGKGPSLEITYSLSPKVSPPAVGSPAPASSPSTPEAFRSAQGLLKQAFQKLGGGEAFLRRERQSFHAAGTDPLHRDSE